jgi:catechol 2,3-dioxygenase-like lactoylglutathione lyase family enzyme
MALGITHIRHVGLFAPNVADLSRFYSEVWGLQPVADDGHAAYLRGKSPEYFLLGLHQRERKGLHHIAFGIEDNESARRAATVLSGAGIKIVEHPTKLAEPGGGFGLRFVDPDGRCIELSCDVATQSAGMPPRNVEPSSICHVVLNTPDIDRITDFYTNVLRFRVSDWSEHQMVFLRCNTKHHVIAFNQAPHASLNHVAYLVSGVDEVMRGVANLKKRGIDPSWGPGRHGPGNNVFCYFKDAAGYVTEYTSDIDYILDDTAHEPKVWSRSPEAIDRWGIAGPPGPSVREAMTGAPDPGWLP